MGGKKIEIGNVENGNLILDILNINGERFFKVQCVECGEINNMRRPRNNKACSCSIRSRAEKRIKDLTGQRFGRLVVKEFVEVRNNTARWLCQCDCGNTAIISSNSLKHSGATSCGCAKKEQDKIWTEKGHKSVREIYMTQGTVKYNLTRAGNRGKELPKGVTINGNKYQVMINFRKERFYLGRYSTVEEAHAVRLAAEELLYKPVLRGEIVPDYDPYFVRDYAQANAYKFLQ